MSRPTPAQDYRAHPDRYVHGRCRPCGVVLAWKAGARRRLKDGPSCPDCGERLSRTCAALLRNRRVYVRDPIWNRKTARATWLSRRLGRALERRTRVTEKTSEPSRKVIPRRD